MYLSSQLFWTFHESQDSRCDHRVHPEFPLSVWPHRALNKHSGPDDPMKTKILRDAGSPWPNWDKLHTLAKLGSSKHPHSFLMALLRSLVSVLTQHPTKSISQRAHLYLLD